MNLNEFFFFKVFPCSRDANNKLSTTHNQKNCYFYHVSYSYKNGNKIIIEKDRRREPISFSEFFKNLQKMLKEKEDNFNLSIDTIFEFTKDNKYLKYYLGSLPFRFFNRYLYFDSDCCLNTTELIYHINKYKKKTCYHYNSLGKCKHKFCRFIHWINRRKDNSSPINIEKDINQDIIVFEQEINRWKEKKEIQLKEIIKIYEYILSSENSYLSKLQINEITENFKPFQNWYHNINNKSQSLLVHQNYINLNEIDNDYFNIIKSHNEENNYDQSQRIIDSINYQLSSKNNELKIHKNQNIFKTLNISNNVCFLSKLDKIKLGEAVKYVYAMLNSSDGVIIYGGNPDNKNIKGISLDLEERKVFQEWFNTEFFKILIVYDGCLNYKFYDLANNNNNECILVIEVKKIKDYKLLRTYYASKCFIIDNQLLAQNKNANNLMLREEDIIELDMRAYLAIIREKLLKHYKQKFKINNIK